METIRFLTKKEISLDGICKTLESDGYKIIFKSEYTIQVSLDYEYKEIDKYIEIAFSEEDLLSNDDEVKKFIELGKPNVLFIYFRDYYLNELKTILKCLMSFYDGLVCESSFCERIYNINDIDEFEVYDIDNE